MNSAVSNLYKTVLRRESGQRLLRVSLTLWSVAVTLIIGASAFALHFSLSAIGFLYLVTVVLVALRWGFVQATFISITAVVCMDFLFVPPIFQFQATSPEDWISLTIFEASALLVSGVSSKLRMHAEQLELERARTAKLYELSRAILLIDGHSSTSEQLSTLIRRIVQVEAVDIWVIYELGSTAALQQANVAKGSALEAFIAGTDGEDKDLHLTRRVLKLGTQPIGAMVLREWANDPLLADAVASIAAVAIERARAIQRETRAEAERNTEQLRTAVLDGLAHGFKTPLTAIQTASSGLLEINQHLSPTQVELISIIDEQATVLSHLTTRLLKTAALEAGEVRLRRSKISVVSLLEALLEVQDEKLRERVRTLLPPTLTEIDVDAQLVHLALLQLIDNAARYSSGNRAINVTVTQDDRETTVVVANSGPTIPPEEQERIFERFYRGSEASHVAGGTGLGLSIVRKTAEAHGGRAWVDCDGDTTRFFLTMANYKGAIHG